MENPTISSIDLNNSRLLDYKTAIKNYHNKDIIIMAFLITKTKKYLIFGGYGNQLYTNDFNTYDVVNDNLEPVLKNLMGISFLQDFFQVLTQIR